MLCASLLFSSFVMPQDVPTLIPVEEIASLQPGRTTKQILQFHFHQQLTIFCNKKTCPINLQSNIGYFIKPLSLVMDAFMDNGSYKECQSSLFFLHNNPALLGTF